MTLDLLGRLEAEARYYLSLPSADLLPETRQVIGDLCALIPSFRETLGREQKLVYELALTRNKLEAWKSCLNCGNTRADGDFWEDPCPACKRGDAR
jgi:hypothetical protein